MLGRIWPVIDHAHAQHQVELRRGQVFKGNWQQPVWLVGQIAADCQVLHEEQQGWINTDHGAGPRLQRTPAEVAVSAANIQYPAARQ